MISDSPYRTGEPAITPAKGVLAGLVGAGFSLGVIALLQSLTGTTVYAVLSMGVAGRYSPEISLLIRAAFVMFVGMICGLLYAICEQRGPRGALLFVGLFYGFLLWILGAVITGSFLSEAARTVLRSLSVLSACLVYGIWLSLVAVWSGRKNATGAVVPRD